MVHGEAAGPSPSSTQGWSVGSEATAAMTTATAGPEAAVEYRWHMLLEEIEELSTRLSKATGSALRASSARLESLAAATEARLSATEAARQPGSDAHKGHDSSGPRRGLRNGGVGWAFKLPSPARRTTTGPVETQEDVEPEKAFLPLHEDYVQRCLVRAQRSSELVPSSKLLLYKPRSTNPRLLRATAIISRAVASG